MLAVVDTDTWLYILIIHLIYKFEFLYTLFKRHQEEVLLLLAIIRK